MSYIEVNGNASKNLIDLARCVAEHVIELMNFSEKLEVAIDFVSEDEIKRLNG